MIADEIKAVLLAHAAWARSEPEGKRADLGGADLRSAYLRSAYLRGAHLGGAYLVGADLGGADLRDANLRGAYLRGAKVHAVHWPAPTVVLLANWDLLDDALTADLMRLDAWCHPDPEAFCRWAEGGKCPYDGTDVERVARFAERKALMTPALLRRRPRSPLELMRRVIAACCDEAVPEGCGCRACCMDAGTQDGGEQ